MINDVNISLVSPECLNPGDVMLFRFYNSEEVKTGIVISKSKRVERSTKWSLVLTIYTDNAEKVCKNLISPFFTRKTETFFDGKWKKKVVFRQDSSRVRCSPLNRYEFELKCPTVLTNVFVECLDVRLDVRHTNEKE